jgi:ferritin-like metal-binding protein YciE
MAINNPQELFVQLLSHVRQREEKMTAVLGEIGKAAENPDVKEAIESRIFLKTQLLGNIDRCFKLIGAKPATFDERLPNLMIENFGKELAEMTSPAVRQLYVLAKAKQLVHLHIAEYMALTAMADVTNHFGVGMLLESCLAENLAFVERTRRLLRHLAVSEVGARLVTSDIAA